MNLSIKTDVNIWNNICIYQLPPHKLDVTLGQIVKQGFPSPRLVAILKLKSSVGGKIVGCISFLRVLVLCKIQIALFRI